MKKSDVLKVGLKVGDCLQFDLESGTLKMFRPDGKGYADGRRTRDGDNKILVPGSRDWGSMRGIAGVILFATGMCDNDLEDVSTRYGNRPDTLITFQIIARNK